MSSPTPTVTWERSDSSARGRMTFPFESYGQEMVIDKVEPEDSGQYRCIATNTASTASVSKTFTVEVECKFLISYGKLYLIKYEIITI